MQKPFMDRLQSLNVDVNHDQELLHSVLFQSAFHMFATPSLMAGSRMVRPWRLAEHLDQQALIQALSLFYNNQSLNVTESTIAEDAALLRRLTLLAKFQNEIYDTVSSIQSNYEFEFPEEKELFGVVANFLSSIKTNLTKTTNSKLFCEDMPEIVKLSSQDMQVITDLSERSTRGRQFLDL